MTHAQGTVPSTIGHGYRPCANGGPHAYPPCLRRIRSVAAALIRRAGAAALAASCFFAAVAHGEAHNVLLLTDNAGGPAEVLITGALEERVARSPDDIEVFAETLDFTRFPQPERQALLAEYLRAKYADRRIDAALALGPAALMFLADRRATLFADSPIVYAGVRAATMPPAERLADSTGVLSEFDVVKTVELALALQPDARRLVVVTGTAPLDVSWKALAADRLRPYRERMEVTHLAGLPESELRDELRSLPPDSIVVFLTMSSDGAGKVFIDGPALARELAALSAAPIYSVYDTYLGVGVVGGYVESFEATGDAMAELTLRVLSGERAADVSPVSSASVYAVDSRALRRWNLDEARLPPGTNVLFREPSIWAQYRAEILSVISLVALQTLLIVALLLYIRKRRVERTLRQTEDRYHHMAEAQIDLICRYAPDTSLTFVSDTYCRHFGRSRAELLGRRFIELLPETERQHVLEQVRSLVNGVRSVSYVHKSVTPDGSVRWQQWLDHPIVDARGTVVEIQGIGRDITDLKAAETEAQQRREQVTHLTRVAILGELSGALAHELNQPMTSI